MKATDRLLAPNACTTMVSKGLFCDAECSTRLYQFDLRYSLGVEPPLVNPPGTEIVQPFCRFDLSRHDGQLVLDGLEVTDLL